MRLTYVCYQQIVQVIIIVMILRDYALVYAQQISPLLENLVLKCVWQVYIDVCSMS